jgi:2-dehydropantoate 2-reductase
MEKCYCDGGCLAVFRENILPFIWKKVTVNCTVNTVCAILRLKIGEVEADPNGQKLFHDVIRECCAVATAKGVPMDPEEFIAVDHKHIIDNISDYYPSMAQDMLWKKYRTEIDTLNGTISDYGKQFGIPTPTCDVLSTVVRCIQNNYDKQYVDGTRK